ncbi:MAG: hypothetical protein ACXWQO_08460 [Bdellovibrionota bacterium]
MKIFFLLLFVSIPAHASWYYNEDGGFGIYQPEGWNVHHNGRSSTLTGPTEDKAQSQIFLGSDWVSHIDSTAALEAYVKHESHDSHPRAIQISDLPGFQVGNAAKGAIYLLRINENVIVIQYQLKGSKDQIEEGETMLGSIEIRTKGNEYP